MSFMWVVGLDRLRVMAKAFVGREHDPRLILAVIAGGGGGIGFKIAAAVPHVGA
jgi:hypothetical protein